MNFALIAVIISVTISCKQDKKEQIRNDVEKDLGIYANNLLKQFDSTARMDSVLLIRLDTITNQQKYYLLINEYDKDFETLKQKAEYYTSLMEKESQIFRLSYDLSNTLAQTAKEDAKKYNEKLDVIISKMHQVANIEDSLQKLAKTTDSIGVLDYQAVWFYQYTRADRTIKRDTGYTYVTKDLRLVNNDDYLKREKISFDDD